MYGFQNDTEMNYHPYKNKRTWSDFVITWLILAKRIITVPNRLSEGGQRRGGVAAYVDPITWIMARYPLNVVMWRWMFLGFFHLA